MRLGGTVFNYTTPQEWITALQRCGFRAAFSPIKTGGPVNNATIEAYTTAARDADIVIAEVGAWSNPLSPDPSTRKAAIELCKDRLALADRLGALCCVNISGSRSPIWDGPDPENLTTETFDLIVKTIQEIIDAVKPDRAFYTLETMPWMYPDSVESYQQLLTAIDRPQFAVHLDPVNLICSPQRYFRNADLLRECFAVLGPQIKGVHAKDILLAPKLTTHLDEVRPGEGYLDYRVFLQEMSRLDPDTPLMLEHLPSEEEYRLAAEYVRRVAEELGITL
jgi:sugar phosphate isomerase/epimerase